MKVEIVHDKDLKVTGIAIEADGIFEEMILKGAAGHTAVFSMWNANRLILPVRAKAVDPKECLCGHLHLPNGTCPICISCVYTPRVKE